MKNKLLITALFLVISLSINSQNYERLWNEYENDIENLLPESALKSLNKIEKQALKDTNDIQLLKTVIKRCEVFQMKEENAEDTIVGYCKYYLPKLSEASQAILNVELAQITNDYSFIDGDFEFAKTIMMDDYAELFGDDYTVFNIKLEPTLYDYVMHCIIKHYNYNFKNEKVDECYQKLIEFDKDNNYIAAYYNNKCEQLGYINNIEKFNQYTALAEECPDNEIVAKIKVYQISYLTDRQKLVEAKDLCYEVMSLVKPSHPIFIQCVNYFESITKKTVSIEMQNVQVPGQAIAASLKYRNITNPTYKIYKVSSAQFVDYSSYMYDDKLVKKLIDIKPIAQNTINIPQETDYLEHSSLIALPALQNGAYFLMFSPTDSFENHDYLSVIPFQVSSLSYMSLIANNDQNIYVMNRETGKAMSGVKAEYFENKYSYKTNKYERSNIGNAVSDAEGLLMVPSKLLGQNVFINLYFEGDTLLPNKMESFRTSKSNKTMKMRTSFYTDRGIYRPGQTVRFKAIVYKNNSMQKELVPDYQTTVKLLDANGQLIDTLCLTTDEFGSVSGSFKLPSDRMSGDYTIKNEIEMNVFTVEEYKRPTFEVTFVNPDKEYKIGDSVSVSGKVMALSGFGLDNVKYSYTVTRKTSFPFRCWGFEPYDLNDEMLCSGEGNTSTEGGFKIDFQMIPGNERFVKNSPKYTYEINVLATNSQGETQEGSFSITATYNLYDIRIEDELTTLEDFKNAKIKLSNTIGKPVCSDISIVISKIEDAERYPKYMGIYDRQLLSDSQLKEYFPHFDYYHNDSASKNVVYQDIIKVDKESGFPRNIRLKQGRYLVELQAVDDSLSRFSAEYVLCDAKPKKVPCRSMYWTHIDKTSAQPGETINYYVGSSEKDIDAIVFIMSGNNILKTERFTLNDNVHKTSYKVTENDRGKISIQVGMEKYNTELRYVNYVEIPFDNLKLDVILNTERKAFLPGEKETWTVTIKDYKNKAASACLLAGMYDASLDLFTSNKWEFYNNPYVLSNSSLMSDKSFNTIENGEYFDPYYFHLEKGMVFSDFRLLPSWGGHRFYLDSYAKTSAYANDVLREDYYEEGIETASAAGENTNIKPARVRSDFNETAFFYPDLRTDKNGDATFTFTMPDALTRWNLQLLAYSKDLKVGTSEKTFVTQQPLMIMADMPRFAYDTDSIWLVANVINLSENALGPIVKLEIFDKDNNPIDLILSEQTMELVPVPAGQSQSVRWLVAMRKDLGLLTFRFSAGTDGFSDAEQHMMPVLSSEVFMTQTYAITTHGEEINPYDIITTGADERNYSVKVITIENPLQTAIQALPYIADGDEKSAVSAFNRYFTNSMAKQIVENHPEIKELYANLDDDDNVSELQKNEELKAVMLQETPWVMEAQNETEQRRNVAKLFDTESLDRNIASAMEKLQSKQTVNGGWSWFEGMPESEFITQYILHGLGRLGLDNEMTENAYHFIENEVITTYKKLDSKKKLENYFCSSVMLGDLMAMSYFNYPTDKEFDKAKAFFLKKLENDWKNMDFESQANAALVFARKGDNTQAMKIVQSLRERAIKSDMGMYWRNSGVETVARILEALNELDPKAEEQKAMRLWILTQKRTNMWENERATVEAVSALVGHDYDVQWTGVYRQYFVPIDKVKKHNDAMKIRRDFFVERIVDNEVKYLPISEEEIKVGDKLKVQLSFENSQDMEFVYLKDLRGACLEPTEQISSYHYGNGLWYYQSSGDVAEEFFFEHLAKGKHELSYTVYVTKEGAFSAGYSVIQCQYAPEFGAYSNSIRLDLRL